jgi:hypothetical protein
MREEGWRANVWRSGVSDWMEGRKEGRKGIGKESVQEEDVKDGQLKLSRARKTIE